MHRAHNYVAAACLAATAAAPLAAQGFDGVVQFLSYGEQGHAPDTMTQITKGSKIRFQGMGRAGGGAMIINGTNRFILIPERKQYMVMPALMGNNRRPEAKKMNGVAVRTGQTETVAGIPCEVWHYAGTKTNGTPEAGDACLAKGVGFMLNRLAGGDMAQALPEGGQAFGKALDSGMGVMKMTRDGKVELVAVKVQPTSVPDAMFSPPPDYTVLDMSNMRAMMKKP